MTREELRDELWEAMTDRQDIDVSLTDLADACIERLEKLGVLPPLPTEARETDREALKRIADELTDQRDEPWPTIRPEQRVHYWRNKAINAANDLKRIAEGMKE